MYIEQAPMNQADGTLWQSDNDWNAPPLVCMHLHRSGPGKGKAVLWVVHRVLGVLHRMLGGLHGVLHRVLGELHRVLGELHGVLGVLHRVLGVLHRVLGVPGVLHRPPGVPHRALGVLASKDWFCRRGAGLIRQTCHSTFDSKYGTRVGHVGSVLDG